jgi:hypothetical protein
MSYFSKFPLIRYNNNRAINLILRTDIIESVFNRSDAYYPYVIRDNITADYLAYKIYGNPELSWVIYFSNKMIDPLFSWPLTDFQLNNFLRKKYDMPPQLLKNEIKHYVYTGLSSESDEDIARKSWFMTPETFSFLSPQEKSGWTPVYIYDYEFEENEKKRRIQLINPIYLNQIQRELEILLNE